MDRRQPVEIRVITIDLGDRGVTHARAQHGIGKWVLDVLLGVVAGVVSWGLYGPVRASSLLGTVPASPPLTVVTLPGVVVVGFSGRRWLQSERDKQTLHTAASFAAAKPADTDR